MTYKDKGSYESSPPCIRVLVYNCGSVWQSVVVCCSVLQCVAVCCSRRRDFHNYILQHTATLSQLHTITHCNTEMSSKRDDTKLWTTCVIWHKSFELISFWTLCHLFLNFVSSLFELCVISFWTLCHLFLNFVSSLFELCVISFWTLCHLFLHFTTRVFHNFMTRVVKSWKSRPIIVLHTFHTFHAFHTWHTLHILHTATHCNALQHTATHCNALRIPHMRLTTHTPHITHIPRIHSTRLSRLQDTWKSRLLLCLQH